MKAVLLAGGLGSRLSEETDLVPKPMVEIGGQVHSVPLIVTVHPRQRFIRLEHPAVYLHRAATLI